MKPAGKVILEALDKKGHLIFRDYALKIAVLLVGANSKVGGLREFCALASFSLAMDCVMLATFYTAVLTIMLEHAVCTHFADQPSPPRVDYTAPAIFDVLASLAQTHITNLSSETNILKYQSLVDEDIILLLNVRLVYERLGEALFSPIELEALNASLLLTSGTLLSNSFPTSLLPDPSTTHPPPLSPSPDPHPPPLSPLTELPSTPTPEHIDLQKYDYCKPSHQYMHKPFPDDKYKEPLDGRRSSGSVKMRRNDMDMFLLYCADAGADEEGDDIDMCRWLAGGVDATSPLDTISTPVVTVLRTPLPCSSLQAWKEHISEAHSILAQGHAVAILDYVETGPENKWSEESLCAIASSEPDGARIQWQSAKAVLEQSEGQIFSTVKGTIQKFWCDATDPTEQVNCLDIVMYGHPIPYIISQLSSVSQALSATAVVGFQGGQLKPDNKPPKKKQRLEHVLAELKGSDNSLGIGSMEWDADCSSSWGLLATAGAFTAPHHDAGGTLTFVLCRRGLKVWSVLEPKHSTHTTSDAISIYRQLIDKENTDEYFETIKKLTTPALPANTLLIQPPGCVHQVYTLDNSICTGGHFLMLDSMHLTEITRIGAVITKQTATNASHPSVIRLLSRITIGILFENNCNVLRKPFISLARMILWPTMYIEGDLDPDNPSFAYSEESRSELKAAQLIARDILQHNNISVAKNEPTMKAWEEGHWLADDRDVAWNAPGTAVVAIPDRRKHFVAFDNAEA
ncbi:hypothetical protein BC835DRAFT_1413809 [Cytidiella melzeri]|nr:hypothetical protein BC835DRAFT_1413809 [Cytidiella melzeri]